MFKKLCALIMAFVMVASLCAVQGFAAGGNGLLREDYRYFKGADALSGAINAGDTITAKCNVYNTNDANQAALLITALYSSSGDLAAVNYTPDTLTAGQFKELEAQVSAPATPANATYTVASYLWDSFGSLVPCVDVDTAAPAAPVVASTTTTSTVALSWEAVADTDSAHVLGYNVYRDGAKVGTTTNTSFTDANVADGAAVNYTVSSYGVAGEGAANLTATTKNIATVKVADLPSEWFSTGIPCANEDFDTEDGIYVRNLPGSYTQNQQVPFKTPAQFTTFVADSANEKTTNIYSLGEFFGKKAYASFNMSSSGYGLTLKAPTSSAINTGSTAADRTMIITYYDNGTDPFFVRYRVPNGTSTTWNVIEWNRGGTNQWVTKEITLTGALLKSDNQQIIFAPSTMSASNGTNIGYDPVYISEVGIAVPAEYTSNIPASPANLAATTTTSTVALTWAASANAEKYDVYRDGVKVATTTSPAYSERFLEDGTTYNYVVCAINAAGVVSAPAGIDAATKNIASLTIADLPTEWFSTGIPYTATSTTIDEGELQIQTLPAKYNPSAADVTTPVYFKSPAEFETLVAEEKELATSEQTKNVISLGTFYGEKAYAAWNVTHGGYGLTLRGSSGTEGVTCSEASDRLAIIRYYDNGTDPLFIRYRNGASAWAEPVSFNRTNTNQWITREVLLEDALFASQSQMIILTNNKYVYGYDPIYVSYFAVTDPATHVTSASFEVSEFSTDWFTSGIPFGANKTSFADGNLRIVDFPASFSATGTNNVTITYKTPAEFAALVESEKDSSTQTKWVYSLGEFFGEKAYAQYNMITNSYGLTINIPETSNVATSTTVENEATVEVPENRTLLVRYYDNGTDPIDIRYRKNASGTYSTVSINRTGTNKWIEKEITLDAAVLYNAARGQHILFDGTKTTGNDPIYISKVAVIK